MNDYNLEEYQADMALLETERAAARAEKVRQEGLRTEFLRTVFSLSNRVNRVVLGSTMDEENGVFRYYLNVHMDGGEIVYPESMPEVGKDPEADTVLDAVDALNDTQTLGAFALAILGDDWESYTRSEVVG